MKITFLPEAMVDRLTELGIDYENWAWFWPFWPEVLRGEMCLMTRDYKDGGKLAIWWCNNRRRPVYVDIAKNADGPGLFL
jgi:hypothetical protein